MLRGGYKHVEFQTEQLAIMRSNRSAAPLWMTLALHRILFIGTVIVVGWSHRRALARGGYSLRRFWAGCMREFRRDFAAMRPYRLPEIGRASCRERV